MATPFRHLDEIPYEAWYVIGAIVFLAASVLRRLRSRRYLDSWAARQGIRILTANRCEFRLGPFTDGSVMQVVFRITAEYPDGQIMSGWARCGGYFRGLWVDSVELRFDPPSGGFPVIFPTAKDAQ